jgi:hypothetical protein
MACVISRSACFSAAVTNSLLAFAAPAGLDRGWRDAGCLKTLDEIGTAVGELVQRVSLDQPQRESGHGPTVIPIAVRRPGSSSTDLLSCDPAQRYNMTRAVPPGRTRAGAGDRNADGIERSTNGRRRGRMPHSSERTESARIVSGQTLTATAAGIIAVQALDRVPGGGAVRDGERPARSRGCVCRWREIAFP